MYMSGSNHNPQSFTCPHLPLKHGLQVLSHMERRLGLGLDLLDRHAVGNLDQRQPVGKVDVKDTLSQLASPTSH